MNTQPRKIVKTHQIRSSRVGRLLLLISDKSEEIANIEWTATGKVRRITRTPQSGKPDLEFRYDASGNRVSKTVISKTDGNRTTTYYVRDAQGTTLATYTEKSGELRLSEQHLYGAKRLGMRSSNLLVATTNSHNGEQEDNSAEKRYELTNHLGNVLAVVSDQKKEDGSAQILNLMDYYPFGMEMDGRKYEKDAADGGYRYGFEGHEKEDIDGSSLDFGERIYDARLGRWSSIDILSAAYPKHSPYNFVMNNPTLLVDPDGMRVAINSQLAVDDLNALLVNYNTGEHYNIFYANNGFMEFDLGGFRRLLESNCADEVKYIACAAAYLVVMDVQVGLYYSDDVSDRRFNRHEDGTSNTNPVDFFNLENSYEALILSTLSPLYRSEVSGHELLGHIFYWVAVNSEFETNPEAAQTSPANKANAIHAVSISNLIRRIQNGGMEDDRSEPHDFIEDVCALPNWDMKDYNIMKVLVVDLLRKTTNKLYRPPKETNHKFPGDGNKKGVEETLFKFEKIWQE